MTRDEHIARHKLLHQMLDELVADWLRHTDKLPSTASVLDLINWSHQETKEPTPPDHATSKSQQRRIKLQVKDKQCERKGCANPKTYPGARYCGAACSQLAEAGE